MTSFTEAQAEVRADLVGRHAVRRLLERDHTLWRDDPTELADRLGWIPVVGEVLDELPSLAARCDALVDDIDDVLVMGMGGSSLFPEVLARTLEPAPGRPRLHVLDTTDPAAIARIADSCPPARTLHLASSKSGSTIETRSHLEWAWARAAGGGRFAVVTDPGSELASLARDRGFADVFENRADIGGRYSALSLFGVVPALLMGADAAALLRGGLDALSDSGPDVEPGRNPALRLAVAMVAGVRSGRDKATFVLPPEVATLGLWIEQLVAESLGKDGTGVTPIVGEPVGTPDVYGDDRLFLERDAARAAGGGRPSRGGPHRWPDGGRDRARRRDPGAGHRPRRGRARRAAVRPARRGGRQGGDQRGARRGRCRAARPTARRPARARAPWRSPRPAGVRRSRGPRGPRARGGTRRAARSPPRGGEPRVRPSVPPLHRPAPQGRAAVDRVHPGRRTGPPRDRHPRSAASASRHLKRAQAAGDLRTLQARGIRAGRVDLDELLSVSP